MFKKYNKFYLFIKVKNPFKKKKLFFFIKKNFHTTGFKKLIIKTQNNKLFSYNWNKRFYFKFWHENNLSYLCKTNFKKKYYCFLSIYKYFYIKLKFYGKTFRWIFSKKKIRFKVQKAHKTYVLFKYLKFKKKRKFKFKLRIYWITDKKKLINIIKKIKYVNLFTKKGLRILKTKLFKKKGKVSGYM